MLAYAIDNQAPATIVLISGDRDFAYAVSVLRLRRYRIVLVAPPQTHISLKSQATKVVDWNCEILEKFDNAGPASPQKLSAEDLRIRQHLGSRLSNSDPLEVSSSHIRSESTSNSILQSGQMEAGSYFGQARPISIIRDSALSSSGDISDRGVPNGSSNFFSSSIPYGSVKRRVSLLSQTQDDNRPITSFPPPQTTNRLSGELANSTDSLGRSLSRQNTFSSPSSQSYGQNISSGILMPFSSNEKTGQLDLPKSPRYFSSAGQQTRILSGGTLLSSGESKLKLGTGWNSGPAIDKKPVDPAPLARLEENANDYPKVSDHIVASSISTKHIVSSEIVDGSSSSPPQIASTISSRARNLSKSPDADSVDGKSGQATDNVSTFSPPSSRSSSVASSHGNIRPEATNKINRVPGDCDVIAESKADPKSPITLYGGLQKPGYEPEHARYEIHTSAGAHTVDSLDSVLIKMSSNDDEHARSDGVVGQAVEAKNHITSPVKRQTIPADGQSKASEPTGSTESYPRPDLGLSSDHSNDSRSFSQINLRTESSREIAVGFLSNASSAGEYRNAVHSLSSENVKELETKRIPPHFEILVRELRRQQAKGVSRPSRSEVAIEIVKQDNFVYRRAGVGSFKEYSSLAAQAQIVVMGGIAGEAWISLPAEEHIAQGPQVVSHIPPPTIPPHFEMLVEQLQHARSIGAERPLRSVIGNVLSARSKTLYRDTGFGTFKDYVAAAEQAGIIHLGGAAGYAWMSLRLT